MAAFVSARRLQTGLVYNVKRLVQYLEIDEGRYWRSESFLKHLGKAITIFEAIYPGAQGNLHSDVNSLLTNITNGWLYRGCLRQPLYCFHFDFRYVTLDIYIYIYI